MIEIRCLLCCASAASPCGLEAGSTIHLSSGSGVCRAPAGSGRWKRDTLNGSHTSDQKSTVNTDETFVIL